MGEAQEIVTTGVDALIALLRTVKLISITDAAKAIRTRENVVQYWVDFLIEEGILGVEYKFITPYIYLKTNDTPSMLILDTKEDFYKKARARGISDQQIGLLWGQYLAENMPTIKAEFFKNMENRKVPEAKREGVWAKYEQMLRGDTL